MPDAKILQNGDKIYKVKEIDGEKVEGIWWNKREEVFCSEDGGKLDGNNLLIQLNKERHITLAADPDLGGLPPAFDIKDVPLPTLHLASERKRPLFDARPASTFNEKLDPGYVEAFPRGAGPVPFHEADRFLKKEKPQLFQPVGELDLNHIFTYHPPSAEQRALYSRLRQSAKDFAMTIIATTPPGPDQSAAIRKVREAVMTANAAIALEGRLYRDV